MVDFASLQPKAIQPDDFGVTATDNPAYGWFAKSLADGSPFELPAVDTTVPDGAAEGTISDYERLQRLVTNASLKFMRDHLDARPDQIVQADVKRNKKAGVVKLRAYWIERPAETATSEPETETETEAPPAETAPEETTHAPSRRRTRA